MSSPSVQSNSQSVQQSSASQANVIGGGSPQAPTIQKDANADSLTTFFWMRATWNLNDRILTGAIAKAPSAAGPDTECIRVAKPTARLTVQWASWRKGARAQLPIPYIGDGNTIFISQELDLDNLEIEGADQNYFISSGSLYYAALDRTQITLQYPQPAYLDIPNNATLVVDAPDFILNSLNTQWPSNKANAVITKQTQ